MAIGLSQIEIKVRYLIGDDLRTQKPGDIFTYDGSDTTFKPTEDNVVTVSTVFQNTTELGSGDWSYDSDLNEVTISASLTSGDTIEIRYTYYANYSSNEIQDYVQGALIFISSHNYKNFIVSDSNIEPEPTIREQNLIAMIAAVLTDVPLQAQRTPDISIVFPKTLPKYERIAKIIGTFKRDSHGKFFIG